MVLTFNNSQDRENNKKIRVNGEKFNLSNLLKKKNNYSNENSNNNNNL